MKLNPKILGLVAGVALGAVGIGAAVASQQVPEIAQGNGQATPISASSAPPSPTTPTPSAQVPSTKPSAPPGQTAKPPVEPARPVTAKLDLNKLGRGKAPAVPYVSRRTVISGDLRIPQTGGDGTVTDLAEAAGGLLIVTQVTDTMTGMQVFDAAGKRTAVINHVTTVESSADAATSAYTVQPRSSDGSEIAGFSVTFRDNRTGRTKNLTVPGQLGARVEAVTGTTVYFSSEPREASSARSLYRWRTAGSAAQRVGTVPQPTAVSADATLAASMTSITDYGSCSALVDVSSGTARWKTCDFQIEQISPSRTRVLAGPAYADGYAPLELSALDARSGKLLRKWTGLPFIRSVLEDDDHVLTVDEQDGKSAIVRCTISTGACELATEQRDGTGEDGGERYWGLG
ncbi:MAG TPA: hypothetical protein VFB74_33775 [Kribbellaceae bacterium]|nr:hypothetical protein [Kribbellaceae bacterium]